MKKPLKTIYINPEVLNWCTESDSFYEIDSKVFLRPYEMFQHAEKLSKSCEDDFIKIDLISTLKRCLMKRAQQINQLYNFKNIPIKEKPKHLLDQMSYFGIIKPLMLKNIIEIRNTIEHKDSKPPSITRCMEFLEFVWYYLRSTDMYVRYCPSLIYYTYSVNERHWPEYNVKIEINPNENWISAIEGCIPEKFISFKPVEGWINVECLEVCTYEEYLNEFPESQKEEIQAYRKMNFSDIFFDKGSIIEEKNILEKIINSYFDLVKNIFKGVS